MLTAVEAMFSEDFAGRVFFFDSDAARVFAKIGAARRALGRPISHADAQIVALAQVLGAKLATRNIGDSRTAELKLSTHRNVNVGTSRRRRLGNSSAVAWWG